MIRRRIPARFTQISAKYSSHAVAECSSRSYVARFRRDFAAMTAQLRAALRVAAAKFVACSAGGVVLVR
jgi:hypothetical protein